MNKSNKKSKMLSEIIKEFQQWQKDEGDMEVVITNTNEACFDGFGKTFLMVSPSSKVKFLGIIRSDVVIKI